MSKIKDDFSEENEVKENWVKFNVEGEDKIFGTLVRVWKTKSQFARPDGEEDNTNYEIKADYGSFHALDEKKKVIDEPIIINGGELWSVGGKPAIERQMANIKIGQKVGFKFVNEMKSKTKGFAPAKLIKVYSPKNEDGSYKMDSEFLKERNSDEMRDFDAGLN